MVETSRHSDAVLVTGAAGFIGFHVARLLLTRGERVVGFDNVNDYYDVNLKESRLRLLEEHEGFQFVRGDLADRPVVEALFQAHQFRRVVHLAAQAGVRYSLSNPHAYAEGNLVGFLHILEGCRQASAEHLVYASSSSVYGANATLPFSEHDNVDHPMSLYAASKKANELMAHSYASLYALPVTGLRFFTVYGPWGRPDMALFLFTKAILEAKPLLLFNGGDMVRDFTYVDDIVEGVVRVLDRPAQPNPDWSALRPDPATSYAPYRVFNIGNSQPVQLLDFVSALEEQLGRKAIVESLPMQAGDVRATQANVTELERAVDFRPSTTVGEGMARFVAWYREYYNV
ncbi:MAG: NAD-dependent epimerase [Acidobacteriota bacterium]